MTASGWGCQSLPSSALASAQSCATGSVSQWNGTSWTCDSFAAQTYPCPPGYASKAVTATGYSGAVGSEEGWSGTICTAALGSGQIDEMVKVGDFWIDRFEMSGSTSAGASCGANSNGSPPGYLTGASGGAYDVTTATACSVRGVQPVASITWFQAEQMCLNAGKELCTNEEWQAAVSGTPDPGNGVTIPYGGVALDACNVAANAGRGSNSTTSATPANTLSHVDCVSTYGAYDMIGNLWEWTGEWWQAGVDSSFSQGLQVNPWPSGYGDGADSTWNLNGSAYGTAWTNGLPAAALRGGNWGNGSAAGAFALSLSNAPTTTYTSLGARCCVRGR
jgi:formylglycine-generating enzyme required for sulfatase activity